MLIALVTITMVMVAASASVSAVGNLGSECPEKFELVSKSCLHVFPGFDGISPTRPWDVARKRCHDLAPAGWSTDFLILKDEVKLSIISKHIYDNYKAFRTYAWWVGARQVSVKTSSWMWLDDTPLDSYSYMWLPDQPKVNTTTNVAMLVPASTEPFRLYLNGVANTSGAISFLCEAVAK